MSQRSAQIEGGHAYNTILELLERRRKLQEPVLGPPWLEALHNTGMWLLKLVAPAFFVIAGAGAVAGSSRLVLAYLLFGSVLAALLGTAVATGTMVPLLIRWLRSKRTRHTHDSIMTADCVLAERLAACPLVDLRTLRHVLATRLERQREIHQMLLGPAAKISPFLMLCLLVLFSRNELIGVVTQLVPALTTLASTPLGVFVMYLAAAWIIAMRWLTYFQADTISVNLMLLDAALERIDIMKSGGGHILVPDDHRSNTKGSEEHRHGTLGDARSRLRA
jgi:hypothetical protein